MGYYWHTLDRRWRPMDHSQPSPQLRRQRIRRSKLMTDLFAEMQDGNSVTKLYAGLLARALIDADQELMREFGERVVECTSENART
jgi:hypothetical protein